MIAGALVADGTLADDEAVARFRAQPDSDPVLRRIVLNLIAHDYAAHPAAERREDVDPIDFGEPVAGQNQSRVAHAADGLSTLATVPDEDPRAAPIEMVCRDEDVALIEVCQKRRKGCPHRGIPDP